MMKHRPVLSALLLSGTLLPTQEPGTAPACWFENVHAADDSIQRNKVLLDTEGNNLLVHVLEHEIGHVMIGADHADTGNCPALLFWTETNPSPSRRSGDPRDRARLMCSGEGMIRDQPGKQLIYKEWTLIEAMRAEVLASAGKSRVKSEEELRAMQDRDESEASEWTYLSYCERTAFPTLALLPSPETVAVLGHFLEDPQGRDGKTLLGNPMNGPDQDYDTRKTTAECAAIAIRKLGIEHPPARPPAIQNGQWAPPAEIDAWKDWWHEVKAGQRTYRFTGSPTKYGPDGPVSAEKLQAIERDRNRDAARAAGRDGPAAGGAASATGAEPDGKPSRTPTVLIATIFSIAAALWYFLRARHSRPA